MLDSTRVRPAAVASLGQERSDLVVFQTQRGPWRPSNKLDVLVDTEPIEVPAAIQSLLADQVPQQTFRRLAPGTPEHAVAIVLDTRGAKITDDDLKLIAAMPTLKWLRLADASITGDGLKLLSGLDELVWLDLSGTQIGDEALPYLQQLDRLETLWLHRTQVGDAGLRHLATLSRLKHVDLRRTRVSDAGLESLAGMRQLESVYLHWTGVTERGLTQLHERLVQPAALVQVLQQGREPAVKGRQEPILEAVEIVAVRVPVVADRAVEVAGGAPQENSD